MDSHSQPAKFLRTAIIREICSREMMQLPTKILSNKPSRKDFLKILDLEELKSPKEISAN